jgi:uncharacterized membrane protein (UPF0127 family)
MISKILKNWHIALGSVLVAAILIIALSTGLRASPDDVETLPTEQITIETQKGEKYIFNVEMAMTGSQHSQGLMNREQLAEDSGMLFVFHSVGKRSFWMKDTLIPLDMLFIDEDGTINHIHPMAKPLDRSYITSDKESKAVLELGGGTAQKYGITDGDKIIHAVFRNDLAP